MIDPPVGFRCPRHKAMFTIAIVYGMLLTKDLPLRFLISMGATLDLLFASWGQGFPAETSPRTRATRGDQRRSSAPEIQDQ